MERRRQYYTDTTVQGYLLAAFIGIELLLLGLLLLLIYGEINDIIDAHLFRVHVDQSGAWPELFRVLATAIGSFLLINVLLLYLAHRVWSRYVSRTIDHFSMVLDKLAQRDFDGLDITLKRRHPTAALMELWYEKEKARSRRIDSLLGQLARFQQDSLTEEDRDAIQRLLAEYRRLLQAA